MTGMHSSFEIFVKKLSDSTLYQHNDVRFPEMKTHYIKSYKNAIYRYDYPFDFTKYANLGDDMQSLAALQFLPTKQYLTVDRDTLKEYSGEPVNLIANAWYRLSAENESFSPKINPLLISIHLESPILSPNSVNFFKKYEPIGCRDLATLKTFRSYGIKSFFSACLTLTLGEKYTAQETEKTDEIIFVDLDIKKLPDKIASPLKKYLENYDLSNVISITHRYDRNKTDNLAVIESLLKRYARAKLVVTSRIHVALPCLAVGTPVILVRAKKRPDNRFGGLIQFVNFLGYGEFGEFTNHVLTDSKGFIINDNKHIPYAKELKRTARAFFDEK